MTEDIDTTTPEPEDDAPAIEAHIYQAGRPWVATDYELTDYGVAFVNSLGAYMLLPWIHVERIEFYPAAA